MGDVITVDFKKLAVLKQTLIKCAETASGDIVPRMRWSKEEIQDIYDEEIDANKYNGQCYYDYSLWVSSPYNGDEAL